jgi:tetratricopeptide (TPR) repeat protein
MIESLLQRAQQLLQTGRYKEAEKELRMVLTSDPNRAEALALFAICRSEQGAMQEAMTTIQNAIGQQPANDYYLYLRAIFLLKLHDPKEAEKNLRVAISLNPESAEYFGLLAAIKLEQKEWQDALDFANAGLEKEGDNLQCLNARSTALYKLNRKDESFAAIHEALNQDPENEQTHTNVGWSLLEQGDHKKALEHFREALKINPNHTYAKAGMVEGLKARYWFYRIFLKYVFWLSNMKAKGQWAVILGLYFGVRLLRWVAQTNNTLSMILTPIIFLYFAFAISTWIIEPLSNLFLRLNVYGRYALTPIQVRSSNLVGISLLIGLTGGLAFLLDNDVMYLMILIFGVSMMIPLASMYNPSRERNKRILVAYAIVLAIAGIIAIVFQGLEGDGGWLVPAYILGLVAYQWIANALMIR